MGYQGPSETVGDFPVFIFGFYQIMKRGFFDFDYFSLRKIFHNKIYERRQYDFSKITEILEEKILKLFIRFYLH